MRYGGGDGDAIFMWDFVAITNGGPDKLHANAVSRACDPQSSSHRIASHRRCRTRLMNQHHLHNERRWQRARGGFRSSHPHHDAVSYIVGAVCLYLAKCGLADIAFAREDGE